MNIKLCKKLSYFDIMNSNYTNKLITISILLLLLLYII